MYGLTAAGQPGYHLYMPYVGPSASNPDARQGFVYVLQSPSMRGPDGVPILKIGATRKHPLQRAKELSAGTGVPEPFVLAYYRDFDDAFLAESLVHEAFASVRTNEAREFFAAGLAAVVAFIDSLGTSAAYRSLLSSQGIVGGECPEPLPSLGDWGPPIETPWSELFATFPDDGSPRELTPEEQAKCRALAAELADR